MFHFQEFCISNSTDRESLSLNFHYILKQNFLSVGSNTGQTHVFVVFDYFFKVFTWDCPLVGL